MSAPHLATPTNFFLGLAFSGPLSSPHAYATRAGPTLDSPLPSYKPGSPRALTCSPLRACQSCLPGAQRLIRVAPISHLLCGLLALSSASLHKLVSQSTRNMIDWLGFLFPCAFLYTTDSPVACGVRVCKLLPCSNLFLPFPFATCLRHACLLNPRPAFVFLQALHSPRATLQPSSHAPIVSVRRLVYLSLAFTRLCHSCLPDTRLLFHVRRIQHSLQAFLSAPHLATHKLLPWPSLFWPFEFPTCSRHACLPDAWLAFVFLQAWQSPRANLQPAARVPIVSARRLVRLSLAFPASLCPLYPPNVLFVSPQFHSYFAFPTCGCHSCLWAACAVLCTLPLQSP